MSLGEYIRAARLQRSLSQWELSRLSGLSRSHLSRLELDDYHRPSAQTFLALSKGLRVQPNELYQAAGYAVNARSRRSPPQIAAGPTPDAELRRPTIIPVISNIHLEDADAVGYAYFGLSEKVNKDTIGVLVKGFHLRPDIQEGDVIIVDRGMKPSIGNIILCQNNGKAELMRYDKAMASNANTSGNNHIYGVVIGLNKNLT